MAKSARETAAIKRLDQTALEAQARIVAAETVAKKLIADTAEVAIKALEDTARIPDRRNLDGSYQWDRGDRYRRGSDDRMERIEEQFNGLNKTSGELEVDAATRKEEAKGLTCDIGDLKTDFDQLRQDFDTANRDITSRLTTMRELVIETKDSVAKQLEAAKAVEKNKSWFQQHIIGLLGGVITALVGGIVLLLYYTIH
jgi:hypothetical protein